MSLAKYLAHELSQKIKNHEITNIKGGFLASQNIQRIEFNDRGEIIIPSSPDISIFRYNP